MRPNCCLVGVALGILLLAVQAKDEVKHRPHDSIHKDHYKDGEHNAEYDHEAVLGSEEEEEKFSSLPPEVAKEKLGDLVAKMDSNQDGLVKEDELTQYILSNLINLDRNEAMKRFNEVDLNNDTKLTWKEYHQFTTKDFDNSDSEALSQILKEEEKKFNTADIDKDGQLTQQEFLAFYHPYHYPYMLNHLIEVYLNDYDKDKDGYINLAEFSRDANMTKEEVEADKREFERLDVNKDGRLNQSELRPWFSHDYQKNAVEEAKHLMSETGGAQPGQLTKTEIVAKHDLWVGSQATDYGEALKKHDPEEL